LRLVFHVRDILYVIDPLSEALYSIGYSEQGYQRARRNKKPCQEL
jgi:hypothetical protein